MARTVRWTETATEDINEAAAFIARDSPYYAATFVREVRRAGRPLNFFRKEGGLCRKSAGRTFGKYS